jgi:hypothetical protein
MNVRPHVEQVQEQLVTAAALGDEAAQQVAKVLAAAAEPAVRLAILGAVTAAADDVTVALLDVPTAPVVAVRLDGDDVRIDVRGTEQVSPPDETPVDLPDEDATARVSFRLPEALKDQIDAAARRDGVSVNTWLLRAASRAVNGDAGRTNPSAATRGHQRLTGWLNG